MLWVKSRFVAIIHCQKPGIHHNFSDSSDPVAHGPSLCENLQETICIQPQHSFHCTRGKCVYFKSVCTGLNYPEEIAPPDNFLKWMARNVTPGAWPKSWKAKIRRACTKLCTQMTSHWSRRKCLESKEHEFDSRWKSVSPDVSYDPNRMVCFME